MTANEHTQACMICGGEMPANLIDIKGVRYWCTCSPACSDALAARIQERGRREQPDLYRARDRGETLILDPYVGDELAMALLSLESRILGDLTRDYRLSLLKPECEAAGIAGDLAYGLLILAEREPGSNTVDVEIDGRMWKIYEHGLVRPTQGYGYHWRREPGGWQEVRPADDPFSRRYLPDGDMRAPRFGDVEGADAITTVEHGATAVAGLEPRPAGEGDDDE